MNVPDWLEEREYQKEAIQSWLNADGRGIFKMATGTGKTVTALTAATKLVNQINQNLLVIIAVPYQHLVDQWADVLADFDTRPILAYKSRQKWLNKFDSAINELTRDFRATNIVITTYDTFSSETFQQAFERYTGGSSLIIADEVHHLGATNYSQSLSENIEYRLGLSATPERFYDSEGTEIIKSYFESTVFEYTLDKAIENGHLCEYYYVPHVVELTDSEVNEYISLSEEIARNIQRENDEDGIGNITLEENDRIKYLLFKRARLIGTAENKLERLEQLIESKSSISHSLVYCGDGSVDKTTADRTERHVDAALARVRMKGHHAKRFTADEDQATREEILENFEIGDIEALVAIRCLDEGVDIPATKTAYILSSSSNPRQFIQRRGRILRKHSNKQYATIHDFIVAPPEEVWLNPNENEAVFSVERKLVKSELSRVNLFAESARNHPDADVPQVETEPGAIGELKSRFNLRHQ
jgi:DNA phosphorothioation system restriction enzyme